MIKKIFGILVALASVAVLVFTVLHRDRYASLLFSGAEEPAIAAESAEPAGASEPLEPAAPAEPADSASRMPVAISEP